MIPDRELEVTDWRDEGASCEWLRARVAWALESHFQLKAYFLEVHLVGLETSAEVNRERLNHEGPTDVITLDFSDGPDPQSVCGELFICPEIAAEYAKDYGVSPEAEALRYALHGVLHLLGYDDLSPEQRQEMRRLEDRALASVAQQFGSESTQS